VAFVKRTATFLLRDAGAQMRYSRYESAEDGGEAVRVFQWIGRIFENDDKSLVARFWYLWLPVSGSALALILSFAWDHLHAGAHALQRAGSILTFFGGLSAYGGTTRIWIRLGDTTRIHGVHDVPYAIVGAVLALGGTLLWGYGDLLPP
jgi:hypothetical protein